MLCVLLLVLPHLFATIMAADRSRFTPTYLNITAISATNGASTIECWRLTAPFKTSAEAGVSGASLAQLGKAGNVSYVVLPPRFNGGLHNAPAVQYVAFIAGKAIVSTPETRQSAIINGGKDGLIIAADTADVSKQGHDTQYPTEQQTIAIQIPTADGKVPEHTVLHPGPCRKDSS